MHIAILVIGDNAAVIIGDHRERIGIDGWRAGGRYAGALQHTAMGPVTSCRLDFLDLEAMREADSNAARRALELADNLDARDRAATLESLGLAAGEGFAEWQRRRGPWCCSGIIVDHGDGEPTVALRSDFLREGTEREWPAVFAGILDRAIADTPTETATIYDCHE
jgi:hypothetical protein